MNVPKMNTTNQLIVVACSMLVLIMFVYIIAPFWRYKIMNEVFINNYVIVHDLLMKADRNNSTEGILLADRIEQLEKDAHDERTRRIVEEEKSIWRSKFAHLYK